MMASRSSQLRVLVVSLGRLGGVTEYGWLMGRALSQRCTAAVVFSSGAENRQKWSSLDVPRLEVDTFSSIAGLLSSYFSWRQFALIRRFAREFNPDVIYYPGGHAWKPVLDLILSGKSTTVLTVHDPELHQGEDSLRYRFLAAVNRFRVHGYVLLNESQREAFALRNRVDPSRLTVIPHGMFDDFPSEYPPLSDIDYLADVAPHSHRYLLFVGRILPYKGVDTLLAAYRDMSGDAPLVIAGSGEFSSKETEALAALADCPVYVINRWLEPEDISALVSGARFVVLPYKSATQSGVIPLASAFGVPAIASDTGGLAEQLIDGETGFLFPAGESAALASVIGRAISLDDADYAAMSARCKEYARTNWAWDGLALQLLEFSESLRSGE